MALNKPSTRSSRLRVDSHRRRYYRLGRRSTTLFLLNVKKWLSRKTPKVGGLRPGLPRKIHCIQWEKNKQLNVVETLFIARTKNVNQTTDRSRVTFSSNRLVVMNPLRGATIYITNTTAKHFFLKPTVQFRARSQPGGRSCPAISPKLQDAANRTLAHHGGHDDDEMMMVMTKTTARQRKVFTVPR